MTRLLPAAVIVAAVAGLADPAQAQSRREMQMMADIRMLQEQTQLLQQQLQAAITDLSTAVQALASTAEQQAALNRKAFADQKLAVDQLTSDLRIVRERVDETNVRISSLSQELEALRLSMPVGPGPSGDPSAPLPPGSDPAAQAPAPAGAGISPQRLLDTAWADYTAGQWAFCIQGYETYIRTFPRSELAGEAQFYVGECYAADGKDAEAVEAYNRVITEYPRDNRVPEAYYKRGLSFERLGQMDRARDSWEVLMKNYPDTPAARLAKQALDRVGRGHSIDE